MHFEQLIMPSQIKKLYDQCCQYYSQQRLFEALEVGQQAAAQIEQQICLLPNPEEPDAELLYFKSLILSKLSDLLLDLNMPSKAIVSLVKTIKAERAIMEKDNTSSVQRIANSLAKLGQQKQQAENAKKGKSCFYTCNYKMSSHFLQEARQLLIKEGLQKSAEMGLTLAQLGNYHRFMFQDEEANIALQESIKIRRSIFGEDSQEVAESYHGLAQLYADMGQNENALQIIDQSINILEKLFGRKHLKTAKSIYLKGNLILRQTLTPESKRRVVNFAALAKAEMYVSESLEINRDIVGEMFLETADCYHSLGKIKAQNFQSEEFIFVID